MPHQGKFIESWDIQQSSTTGDATQGSHDGVITQADAFSAADLENFGEYVDARDNRNAIQIAAGSRIGKLKLVVKGNKTLWKIALYIRHKWPFGKMPPKVAKY